MPGELLWAESRFPYAALGLVLAFFALFSQYYWGLLPLALLFALLAIPCLLVRPIRIYSDGFFLGNKRLVSSQKPSSISLLVNYFRIPFNASAFVSDSLIRKAELQPIRFSVFGSRGQPFDSEQMYLRVETSENKTYWAGLGQAPIQFNQVNLKELLKRFGA